MEYAISAAEIEEMKQYLKDHPIDPAWDWDWYKIGGEKKHHGRSERHGSTKKFCRISVKWNQIRPRLPLLIRQKKLHA